METITAPELAGLAAWEASDRAADGIRYATSSGITLAKGDPRLLTGVEVLKVGTFNGWPFDEAELDALVARFVELRDSQVFVPPFRVDHSWDVMSVVGWFSELRVEERGDPSDSGTVKPYLVGDVLLNATDAPLVRAHIQGGKFRNRSSEVFPYRSNTGREYPQVFAGCAFVDIPAVEGLGTITLRRGARPADHPLTGGRTMSTSTDNAPGPEGQDPAKAGTDTPPQADSVDAIDPNPEAEGDETGKGGELERGDAVDAEAASGDVAEVPGPPADAEGATLAMREGESAVAFAKRVDDHVAARVALHVEAATRLATFRAKGVVVAGNSTAAETLLGHPDRAVRDAAATVFEVTPQPFTPATGATVQNRTGAAASGTPTPSELRELRGTELTEAWVALTSEQRKSADYAQAYASATGTRPPSLI